MLFAAPVQPPSDHDWQAREQTGMPAREQTGMPAREQTEPSRSSYRRILLIGHPSPNPSPSPSPRAAL